MYFFTLIFVFTGFLGSISASPKIDPKLLDHFQTEEYVNAFLSFQRDPSILGNPDFKISTNPSIRGGQISFVKSSLIEQAASSQSKVRAYLKESKRPHASLWISNQLYVQEINIEVMRKLQEFPEILNIHLERTIEIELLSEVDIVEPDGSIRAEWGIDQINATEAVQLLLNVTGGNVPETRIGVISTGIRSTHNNLLPSYLGDYGWFDPHGSLTPVDEIGVGSHETGIIAGSAPIGVFPLGKWMSCRGCESFGCLEYAILKCAEFMTCPTLPDGSGEDCSKAPHVIHGDMWTPSGDSWYDGPLELWEKLGIITVWPVGGIGPECGSVRYPAEMGNVLAAGGTKEGDIWYERSSTGPSPFTGKLKPEIVAPAMNIVSAYNIDDSSLMILSSTSMGSAHVAGVVAMLKAADPSLSFTQVLIALARGTYREVELGLDDLQCGGRPVDVFPNNMLGFGRLNALASLQYVIKH